MPAPAPEPLVLPTNRPPARHPPKLGRPRVKRGNYRATSFTIENDIFAAAREFCNSENVSLSAYFEALAAADLRSRGLLAK